MTTKLQYSINLLTTPPHCFSTLNQLLNIHHSCRQPEPCLQRLASSMDRILELRNVESMRKMMVMQEQIFKHQVQELHRLYSLQKKLMNEIGNGLKPQKEITAVAERTNSYFSARDDPKELSGSNSGESSRMLLNFALETPAESTRSTVRCFEERKGLKKMEEETDVEVDLTLSIGHSSRKQRSNSTQFTQSQGSDRQSNEVRETGSSSSKTNKGEECGEPSSIISSSSMCQENTRRHWLLQDLSLNRT